MTPTIFALSDSVGETAEMVAKATASQFDVGTFEIIRVPYIQSAEQLAEILKEASQQQCVVCHTIVSPQLREAIAVKTREYGVPTIDIMGPMLEAVQHVAGFPPKLKPGLIHQLDKDYFKRVEAVEFAVKYDDGKNPRGLLKADIVLVGVSRTSKTPLSMYLAHKRIKVANVPLIPEVPVPEELFQVPPEKVVGLLIDHTKLNEIRTERLRTMGLGTDTNYANIERIQEELMYAKKIIAKIGCTVIDVSNRAIEETASKILEIARKNGAV